MTTEGSSAIEDGLGSIDTRFGAAEERRSGPERETVDMLTVLLSVVVVSWRNGMLRG
jgi:hypothetical protein